MYIQSAVQQSAVPVHKVSKSPILKGMRRLGIVSRCAGNRTTCHQYGSDVERVKTLDTRVEASSDSKIC